MSEWQTTEHALAYLQMADGLPHRAVGEATLLEELPPCVNDVLDLGAGDGRLLALVLLARPTARGVALDFSPPMLQQLRTRFAGNDRVRIVDHDLSRPLPPLGSFDAVVSSFAIHHVTHERKRQLYQEVWALLRPGGIFANLEHVASPGPQVHLRFLDAIGVTPEQEDASNQLLDVETQLQWLRQLSFADVDCYWKWRELALLVGSKRE